MTEETYTVRGGEALFEIRGGGFDSALLFGGTPVTLLWHDCEGSVGQFMLRSRRALEISAQVRQLRKVTDGGFDPHQPWAPQVEPLLRLFADGEYRLCYETGIADRPLIEYTEPAEPRDHVDQFYPHDWMLVTTRPTSSLDPARVEYYRQRIRNGVQPLVLSVNADWVDVVLDGHHKLAAYRDLAAAPAVLCIQAVQPAPLPEEMARPMFGDAPGFYEAYVRLKRDHADW